MVRVRGVGLCELDVKALMKHLLRAIGGVHASQQPVNHQSKIITASQRKSRGQEEQ